MPTKKTTSGGSQVFLSTSAQDKVSEIQMKLASVDQASFRRYTGKGAYSLVIEKLAERYNDGDPL